jgi:hypothetical protein
MEKLPIMSMDLIDLKDFLSSFDPKMWKVFSGEYKSKYCKGDFPAFILLTDNLVIEFLEMLHGSKILEINFVEKETTMACLVRLSQIVEDSDITPWFVIPS